MEDKSTKKRPYQPPTASDLGDVVDRETSFAEGAGCTSGPLYTIGYDCDGGYLLYSTAP